MASAPIATPVGPAPTTRRSTLASAGSTELTDRLLFSGRCSGFLRLLEVDDLGRVVHDTHVGHLPHLTGAAQAPDGFLYILTYGSCGSGKGSHPAGAMHRVLPGG